MDVSTLKNQVMVSLKQGNTVRTQTLRTLLSDVRYAAIAKYQADWENHVNEDDVTAVVKKQIKSHKESIEMFTKGGRQDLVDKESAELAILEEFLPPQLTDAEIKKIISEVLAGGETNFGKLMGQVMSKCGGKADGIKVSNMLKESLK